MADQELINQNDFFSNFKQILSQLDEPVKKAPLAAHILMGILTKNPLAMTQLEQQREKERRQALLDKIHLITALGQLSKIFQGEETFPEDVLKTSQTLGIGPAELPAEKTFGAGPGVERKESVGLDIKKLPGKTQKQIDMIEKIFKLVKPQEKPISVGGKGVYKEGIGFIEAPWAKEEKTPEEIKIFQFVNKEREKLGLPTYSFEQWREEQQKIKSETKNVLVNFKEDEEGNVVKIISHPLTGETLNIEKMGKIGKPEKKEKSLEENLLKIATVENIKELPKLKQEAISGRNALENIELALDLIDKGVTGKSGQLKAFLAPYAEFAGIKVEGLSEAQAFQLITRIIAGPMRVDIVGVGPVSDWENKLIEKVSGGKGATKEAAKLLLGVWKRRALSKIENYNNTLNGIGMVFPNIFKVNQPIEIKKAKPKKQIKLSTGKIIEMEE